MYIQTRLFRETSYNYQPISIKKEKKKKEKKP